MAGDRSSTLLDRVQDGAVPENDELVESLADHRDAQRRLGRRAIAELATRDPKLIDELVADAATDLQQDGDSFDRGLRVVTAIARGTGVEFEYPVAELVATITGQRGRTRFQRYRAGTALVAIARTNPSLVATHLEDLGPLLRADDAVVRTVGCHLATELDVAAAHTDDLLRLLDEAGVNWDSLATALAAAGDDDRIPHALIARLGSSENNSSEDELPEAKTPWRAAIALNKYAAVTPAGVGDGLVPYLDHDDGHVQIQAALACARIATQRPALLADHREYLVERAITADSPTVRAIGETIVAGLAEADPPAVGRHLGRLLASTALHRRRAVTLTADLAESLPGIVAVQVTPLVGCLSAQYDPPTHEAAARALSYGGHRDPMALADAADDLVDLQRDRRPAVANVAVMLLSVVADDAPAAFERAVDIHRDRLDADDQTTVIDAVTALRALARGDPETVRTRAGDPLENRLDEATPELTIAVCRALAELGEGDPNLLRTVASEADAQGDRLVAAVARQSITRLNRDHHPHWTRPPDVDIDRIDIDPTPAAGDTTADATGTHASDTEHPDSAQGQQRPAAQAATAESDPHPDRPPEHIIERVSHLERAGDSIEQLDYNQTRGPLLVADATLTDGRQARLLTIDPAIDEDLSSAFLNVIHGWRTVGTHPNVVEVIEWGETPTPWVATDQPAGTQTLSKVADQIDLDQSVSVLEDLTEAVQRARLYNISHSDIRPDLVWLHHDDREFVARLDDWGLEATLTEIDDQPWIRPYTAPELADPDQIGAGETSDVFSLGALAYDLLTGTAPFPDTDDPHEHVQQIERGPTPPSDHGTVPPAVDEPILNALAVDPDNRYDRAQQFVTELRAALSNAGTADPTDDPTAVGDSDYDCRGCGEPVSADATFCPYCGTELVAQQCPNCGAEADPEANFCVRCGQEL